MFEWLAKRSGENEFSPEEQVVFWTKFAGYGVPLKEKKLSVTEARKLVTLVRTVIRTQTAALMKAQGYLFDGLLGQTGGGKALLYHVIELATGRVKCGKVYCIDLETEASLLAETEGSDKVHCSEVNQYIVRYEAQLPFNHETAPSKKMVVLIMPLFQLSLASVLDALFGEPLPFVMFRKLATCLLSAVARFHEIGMSHSDIKPANVMISGDNFVVIDLGSVCLYDKEARECTVGYHLDAPVHCLTPEFDLNCTAVTLARCCIPDFQVVRGMTKNYLMTLIDGSIASQIQPNLYTEAIKFCLSSTNGGEALNRFLANVDADN